MVEYIEKASYLLQLKAHKAPSSPNGKTHHYKPANTSLQTSSNYLYSSTTPPSSPRTSLLTFSIQVAEVRFSLVGSDCWQRLSWAWTSRWVWSADKWEPVRIILATQGMSQGLFSQKMAFKSEDPPLPRFTSSSNERTEEELKRAKDNLDTCTEIDTIGRHSAYAGRREKHAQLPWRHYIFLFL